MLGGVGKLEGRRGGPRGGRRAGRSRGCLETVVENSARDRNPSADRPVHGWWRGWWDPRWLGSIRRARHFAARFLGRGPQPSVHTLVAGLSLACAATPLAACDTRPANQPNVVLLVADDQDYEHFSFLGHPLARTPRIDELAADGVTFTHAFVPMSRCRPAQASLLSGQWPHQSGVYFNVAADHIDPNTCIANRLNEVGYRSFGEGKFWEFNPQLMGFENYTIRNFDTFARRGQEHLFEWLRSLDRDQPFFVWWAPKLPHVPHDPPQRFLDLFDRDAIPVPPWVRGNVEKYKDEELLSLAMEAWLDECVGELMDELERLGELDDTLFVFHVDNGYANGLPSKGTAFDKGLRTPLIFSWRNGIEPGGLRDELVSLVDAYATVLDYAGATPNEAAGGTAGVSLRPAIEGEPFEPRDALYGAAYLQRPDETLADATRDAYAIWARTERWKYVLYLEDVTEADDERFHIQANSCPYPERERGDEDLFDLAADPYELDDLSSNPAHRALMDQLRDDALAWWRDTGGGELDLP